MSGFQHSSSDDDILHSPPGDKGTKRRVVRLLVHVLTNQVSGRKKAKPWLVKLADSCGVNTPTMTDFSY